MKTLSNPQRFSLDDLYIIENRSVVNTTTISDFHRMFYKQATKETTNERKNMAIKEINRPILRELRQDIKAALGSVEEKHGITFTFNNISFSSTEMSTRLQGVIGTDPEEIAKKEWEKHAVFFGLTEADFGREVIVQGKKLTLVGIRPRSPKFPIIAQNAIGKKFKLPVAAVR